MRASTLAVCVITAALTSGCGLFTHANVVPAVGDSCLVSSWVLDKEVNTSGYSLNGAPVSVSGLAGTKLTITSAGEEKEVFDGSEPLVGTLPDGTTLSIMIGGSFDFHLHSDGRGHYTETGKQVTLPTTATAGGSPVNGYHSSYSPGSGTYTCSSTSLTMTTIDGVQTQQFSKG